MQTDQRRVGISGIPLANRNSTTWSRRRYTCIQRAATVAGSGKVARRAARCVDDDRHATTCHTTYFSILNESITP